MLRPGIFIWGILIIPLISVSQEITKEFTIRSQYLNFPVEMERERQHVTFLADGDTLTYSVIRIADGDPDYWVFKDVSQYTGQKLKMTFAQKVSGIDRIYQSDRFAGQDSLYKEKYRPQFHFTTRRGWNNDPNGLVYFDGEYHLFYQHNPYEIHWQNMHWGHAVSTDLVHWKELNDALYPDEMGTMYSGSAVIDKNNTAGWGKNALVAAYTAAGKQQVQCLAYSTDRGRTFTKYEGNPVVGATRDPKVIWYEPNEEWVMALYHDAGIAFYTSKDLKDWIYQSRINGFYECPELFELPVDGDPENKLWVTYGGSGTYLLGDFDGKTFTPRYGKYRNTYGTQYAAQTYNNTPGGRRIQIGWGRIEQPGMPFNQMMCFPTKLTLRTTNEGIRMFSEPIEEVEKLHKKEHKFNGLSLDEVNNNLSGIKNDLLHLKLKVESLNGGKITINYGGNQYAVMDADEINGEQVPMPDPGKLVFDVEILLDKTSIELFFQKGRINFIKPLSPQKKDTGFNITGDSKNVRIHEIKVYEMKSIWD